MCDYSLHAVETRPAQVGETLITTTFRGTSTRGFASESEPAVAVCMLPGTELAGALGAAFDSEGGRDGQAPMLLLPRLGVVLHRSTNKSADAMAQCLADVAARIEPGAVIQRLSSAQEYELSHWEAEKYRQTLGVRSAAP